MGKMEVAIGNYRYITSCVKTSVDHCVCVRCDNSQFCSQLTKILAKAYQVQSVVINLCALGLRWAYLTSGKNHLIARLWKIFLRVRVIRAFANAWIQPTTIGYSGSILVGNADPVGAKELHQ